MHRKLRMGMVGGGKGAFIGAVHRMAATLDGEIELAAGCFSSDPAKSKASGEAWYVPVDRCYGTFHEMMEREAKRADKIDFVSVVTPNFMHFPVSKAALEAGFNVMSDKPMTFDLAEALQLQKLVKRTGLLFGLTHNYTGYPMVKQAREMARSGAFGTVRKIVVEYPQGWLATQLEASGQKQADWRTDPKRAGASCCVGDIGTHAENLAEYISGLQIDELCAEFTTFVPGRLLEDDANCLLRFKGGAKGLLFASQISIDEENGLNIRLYGDKGGLEWHQEDPNTLLLKWLDKPRQILRTSNKGLGAAAGYNTRLPSGHPEGFIEAFANLYRNFGTTLRRKLAGEIATPAELDFPTVDDGVRGMAFLETTVKSAKAGAVWTKMPKV